MKSFLCTFAVLVVLADAPVHAGQPGLVSLSPASVIFTGPATTTWTFVISDTDGPSDLMGMNAIFRDASFQFDFTYQCWFWYDRAANSISVFRNNNWNSAPIGTGGSVLRGEACTINTANATVSTSGNNLSLSVPVTLGGTKAIPQPIYMRAANNAGADTNYQQVGTFTANGTASTFFNVTIAPSKVYLAAGGSRTVQVNVADAPDYNATVNLSLGNFPNGARITGSFNPGTITGSGTSTLTLTADSGAPPHTAGVNVNVTPTDDTGGASLPVLYSVDNGPPALSPVSSVTNKGNNEYSFEAQAVDASKDSLEIPGANILINSSIDGQHACWLWFDAITHMVWMANDDASSWSGMTAGGGSTLQNSQCTVVGSGTTILPSRFVTGVVNISVDVIISPAFSLPRNIYARAPNNSGYDTGYQQVGTLQ